MSAPATGALRELENELATAADSGEPVTFAGLQERFGVGHNDMAAMLDMLRTHGKATEVTPGEWRAPLAGELDDDGRGGSFMDGGQVVVSGAAVGEDPNDGPAPSAAVEALRRLDGSQRFQQVRMDGTRATLSRAMAQALGAEALGRVVLAGIDDSPGPFTLEVL